MSLSTTRQGKASYRDKVRLCGCGGKAHRTCGMDTAQLRLYMNQALKTVIPVKKQAKEQVSRSIVLK